MRTLRIESFYNPSFLAWQLRQNSNFTISDGGYNQLSSNILNTSSELYDPRLSPDLIILLLDFNGLLNHEYIDYTLSDNSRDFFILSGKEACNFFVNNVRFCLSNLQSAQILIVLPPVPPTSSNGISLK